MKDNATRLFITYIILALLLIGCSMLLGSCKVTKEVEKYKYVYDSTAIERVKELEKRYAEMVAYYEKRIADSTGIKIEYNNSCTDSSKTTPAKFIFNENGNLIAEGNLKSVQISNKKLIEEKENLILIIGELTNKLAEKDTKVNVEEKHTLKEVKRSWQWWWLIVGFVGGIAATHNRKRIVNLLKYLNPIR